MSVISNFISILLFLKEFSSNLAEKAKIRRLFKLIAQKLIFSIFCYKGER